MARQLLEKQWIAAGPLDDVRERGIVAGDPTTAEQLDAFIRRERLEADNHDARMILPRRVEAPSKGAQHEKALARGIADQRLQDRCGALIDPVKIVDEQDGRPDPAVPDHQPHQRFLGAHADQIVIDRRLLRIVDIKELQKIRHMPFGVETIGDQPRAKRCTVGHTRHRLAVGAAQEVDEGKERRRPPMRRAVTGQERRGVVCLAQEFVHQA